MIVTGTLRVGAVSFLNSKPLLYGLGRQAHIKLTLDVPSRLLDGLSTHAFDVALLPVIDFQKQNGLKIIPAGGIGCNGPTLTVRIFSPVPIEQISALSCDPDSHTSVALAQIILAERYHIKPPLAPDCAKLMIGDKVVHDEPLNMQYQLDLGAAWKDLTGMPFVFAVWTARAGVGLGDLPNILENAWRSGLRNLDEIIAEHAAPRGWPQDLARQYLGSNLQYEIGPDQLGAITHFHQLAAKHGLIHSPPRPLDIYAWPQ